MAGNLATANGSAWMIVNHGGRFAQYPGACVHELSPCVFQPEAGEARMRASIL